jgi:hypothetical protein
VSLYEPLQPSRRGSFGLFFWFVLSSLSVRLFFGSFCSFFFSRHFVMCLDTLKGLERVWLNYCRGNTTIPQSDLLFVLLKIKRASDDNLPAHTTPAYTL